MRRAWNIFDVENKDVKDFERKNPDKVVLTESKGQLVGINPVQDYIHRPLKYDHLSLYD